LQADAQNLKHETGFVQQNPMVLRAGRPLQKGMDLLRARPIVTAQKWSSLKH
jgi:hypothetical protein